MSYGISMNTIYLKTTRAERKGTSLSIELKRVLSLLDGRSGSDDLARRAAPSLRTKWNELISELVKGGYIVSHPGADVPEDRSAPRSGTVASATDLAYEKLRAAERVIAKLEAAAAAQKAKSDIETVRVITTLEAAAAADKAKTDIEAKAKADNQQEAERVARTAELKTSLTVATEKAAAEIRQSEEEAARAHAELQAAVTAQEKLDTKAKSNAAAKIREQQNARSYAELEAAIHAAKARSDIVEKSKSELKSKNEMHVNHTHRLRELEIENEALKKLLVEAYVKIAALNAASGIKP